MITVKEKTKHADGSVTLEIRMSDAEMKMLASYGLRKIIEENLDKYRNEQVSKEMKKICRKIERHKF